MVTIPTVVRRTVTSLTDELAPSFTEYAELLKLPLSDELTIKKKQASFTGTAAAEGGPVVTDAGSKFFRPSGEAYVPRTIEVGSAKFRDVDIVKTARENDMTVLLFGPPGTGKTALVEAVFPDLVTVQGSGETEVADFVGGWTQQTDGTFLWVDGPLVVAMTTGVPLLIDEIALIDPRVMAVVYGTMDGRGQLVVTANPERGVVEAEEGFYVFGAFNPDVPGAVLSDALLSRFRLHIEVTTDWSLVKKLGVPSNIVMVARNLHHKVASGELVSAPQVRELIAYRDVSAQFGEDFALANLISQAKPEDQEMVTEAIKSVFGRTIESLRIGDTARRDID